MNDLISRQAAIARAVPLNLFGREVMIVSVSELENLPSAQPEPCEDAVSREAVSEWLKQYGQDVLHGKYKFNLMYIWKHLMDLPSAQPEQQWIPCSERLPEVHESGNSFSGIYMESNPVLVYGTCEYEDNAQFHVVTYCDDLDGNTYWSTELDAITVSGVIAWMPLPEPYRERREE